ncbi:glycine--tRNA ligase [Candidatus Woesearchaeota archaeon CG10_big_fil_rev_8_21_14_0_10_44_13]|nr:MAG: glycine--tRNA ligase [Candidatus Woesearchaeota archaeon CG10_big_fil_rev_8_21_14_0_10_44_13]
MAETKNAAKSITIEDMAVFCKKKGFVYQSGEIYGGLSGFFDYGHLGSELKNNIKSEWWKFHVQQRDDIAGIDGSIITHPKVWVASGHVGCFEDILVECSKCKTRYRADHLIEDALKIAADGLKKEDINKLIKENSIRCPKCKGEISEANQFNLMFDTNVGPIRSETSKAYLRPETAQLMFTNFRLVQENARLKLPFGIAQIGKAFRNEISPRDFLFRCREFEQMEIEYFVHPDKANDCPLIKEVLTHRLNIYSAEMQQKKQPHKEMSIKEVLDKKIIKTQWHAYWLATEHKWFISLGADADKFRIRQHLPDEKSHYAADTWDLEYAFPFGWKELQGMANRADFDLKQHILHSKKDLSLFDEETKAKVIPHVIAEPSQGVDRAFLVFMFNSYNDDKERGNIVLKLHPKLAPVKAGVFPLLSNKEELVDLAESIYLDLRKEFPVEFDTSGTVGRRYARADESGIPFCITVDFDSLKDKAVTIRNRDDMKQKRVKISELKELLIKLIRGDISFEKVK